ncbi:MAG TPA: hypothetical protein PK668_02855 [Myxococcota bacterium]|nr:hypothetical protein [Myxococcota bacterium]HRY94489.1 hypothetical protein [Myxococcota bacterium]HSA20063.1 hypothetical protein [Myxococcota bacterium]
MGTEAHRFTFFRSGGVDQVVLRTGADLLALEQLDRKLWVALSMPTHGIEFDTRTLELLDTDHDGRIRAPELLAGVALVQAALRDPELLLQGTASLRLADMREGELLDAARGLLKAAGKAGADALELEPVEAAVKAQASARLNGDGVVPPASAPDEKLKKAIEELVALFGGADDKGGAKGIDKPTLEALDAQAKALSAWQAKGLAEAALHPLAAGTDAAAAALQAVRAKIEDYFLRCRLAAYDTRAGAIMQGAEDALKALAVTELAAGSAGLKALPLARVAPGQPLPLSEGLNPAWAEALRALRDRAVRPLLGASADSLDEAGFRALCAALDPYLAHLASRPATRLTELSPARLAELTAPELRAALGKLVEEDSARAPEAALPTKLETLLRLKRDLVRLAHNFVNFGDFYGQRKAAFKVGTLYLDGKSMDLCVDVTDAAKHATMAPMSSTFLLYCDCTRAGCAKRTIAAALTEGNPDNLLVGRNGVFYDRQGRDWDATVTRIVSQPISIRQAFWSPYKKLARMIEEQAAKRAAAAEEASTAKLGATAEGVVNADKAKPAAPADKPKPKIDVGTVAAIGVAVGGIGAMVTGILSAFMGLGIWMPVGFLGLLLVFSGPSMVLAYQKLRQRNLGPVLDANGWAINVPVKINIPFGRSLTAVAALPKGASRTTRDPFAEKKKPWWLYITLAALVVLALLWYLGKLDGFLPEAARSTALLGANAPAASGEAPAAPAPPAAPAAPAPAP